jgi:molybdopterin-binding protein
MSDLDALLADLRRFAEAREWGRFHSPKNLAMALAGEVGELLAELQWVTEEESHALAADRRGRVRVADELADVTIYLVQLAAALDVDLLTAARAKLARNEERFPRSHSADGAVGSAYAMLRQMAAENLTLGDAATALGVSPDTLRRWDRAGRLRTVRDDRNRRLVPRAEIERLSTRPRRHRTGAALSARNRFTGTVRSVEVDGVMALVELEAGPFLVTAAITRDAVEEMGIRPGVVATAAVKATSVMIERDVR